MLWVTPGVRAILGLTGYSAHCLSATGLSAKYHVIPGVAEAPCGQLPVSLWAMCEVPVPLWAKYGAARIILDLSYLFLIFYHSY